MNIQALPEVKICGLTRRADAETAVGAGASYLGFILAPGGRRTVSVATIIELAGGLDARRVGVFVDASGDELRRAGEAARLDVLQLHGDETPELAADLRSLGFTVWKAVRPRTGAEFEAAAGRWSGAVDALLLDGWSPDAHGGTGARFPWAEVAALRAALDGGTRLVAAGGLRPGNVAEAVRLLRPDVVDVSSGVESAPGVKDAEAIRTFVAAARPRS
ncbi:MAG: N-(5-phosphoribosyl)anthranilate isomerase [Gemmatimonadetes bacterium]|nr:N-(5-phosphoribosyl)anthranilate isomerase [Gemmatimonadota bacterium]